MIMRRNPTTTHQRLADPTPGQPFVVDFTFDGTTRGYSKAILNAMRPFVYVGLKNTELQDIAEQLIGATPEQTLMNDFAYLKDKIPYKDDNPAYEEEIRSAMQTVLNGTGGDCDDMSVAVATITMLQGFKPVLFRAIRWRDPVEFTHVYCVVQGVNFDLCQDELGAQYHAVPGVTLAYLDVSV